jgi:hypothetical protein
MSTFAQICHIGLGVLIFILGLWTFFNPELLNYYSISIDSPDARIAARAIIGGGEIGLGMTLMFGTLLGITHRALNIIAAVVFLSVGMGRLIAVLLEDGAFLGWQPYREGLIELFLGLVAVVAATRSKTPCANIST